jgi:hypothetical protein
LVIEIPQAESNAFGTLHVQSLADRS